MQAQREDRFYGLVDNAANRDPAVRRMATDLKEFADLRNAIVHERGDGHLIAEPHETTVRRLEEIRRLLEHPPQLGSLFRGPVSVAAPEEAVGAVAQVMRDGDFSQIPVYDQTRFVRLLTAETVTRWLAAMLADGVGLVEEAPVADVLLTPRTRPTTACSWLVARRSSTRSMRSNVTAPTGGRSTPSSSPTAVTETTFLLPSSRPSTSPR